jgi:3-(3-hydroxy-phenyl)propionate hydroxylase
MIARGLIVERYQYRDRRTGEVAEFDMSLIADETLFPFRLQLEQYEMTLLVNRMLADYDCAEVRFQQDVASFEQDAEGVTVTVNTAAGTETLRGCFLVGADGASSNVRKAAGIEYAGFTYDEKFLVASTDFPFEDVFENLSWVNYVADPEEWCVILRTDKLWRVLWPTDPEMDEATYLSDDYLQQRLHHLHDIEGDYHIGHRTLYHVHQRVAETYYRGRMALVGDACHINNPLGGMGMNGGLHDAINLAGRLVDIIGEGADIESQLAQYDRQRRELAVRFVQEHTINNKKLMESTDPDIQSKRQRDLMSTAADPVKAKAFIMERAMINCVRDSLATP